MKILIVTINFPPEIGGAPHLIYELARSLHTRGHQITVLTGYPSYNVTDVPRQYRRGLLMSEELDGIAIRRVRIPQLPRASKVARGLQHFIFGLWLGGLAAAAPRADLMLVFSPPLPLPWMVAMVGKLRSTPVVANVQDLFPKQAIDLGMLSNRSLIWLFEAMERQMYRSVTAVTVHSPGNRQHVIDRGGKTQNVHVVYNWVDTERIRPGSRDNEFSRRHGIPDRFVVSYAGTMGWAQDMRTVVDAAYCLRGRKEILFLLVGDGVEKESECRRSIELGLENIVWLPMQPWDVYPEVLAASDVSLINLHPELHTPVVPSKMLSIMAAARPVVASLPDESDARQLLAEAQAGVAVRAGDPEALASAIMRLHEKPHEVREMGRCGRRYVESHFSRDACVAGLEKVLMDYIGGVTCVTTQTHLRTR